MNDETRHVIAHVARPSYPALELDCLANFQNKRHTLSRTLARVRLPTPRTQLSGHDARGRDGPHCRRTGMSLWFFYQIPFIFPAAAREGNSSTEPCTPARSAYLLHIIPKFRPCKRPQCESYLVSHCSVAERRNPLWAAERRKHYEGVRRSATDIHNSRTKSNNREHAMVANGKSPFGELLHAISRSVAERRNPLWATARGQQCQGGSIAGKFSDFPPFAGRSATR